MKPGLPKNLAVLKGLTIYQRKQPGRADSFWYEGEIASYNGYTLVAAGDIRISTDANVSHSCKWEDIATEVKDDAGLNALVGDGKKYSYDNNNWFEVIPPDGDVVTDVAYDYDEAIELLLGYGEQDEPTPRRRL